jgi:hypothetical protein
VEQSIEHKAVPQWIKCPAAIRPTFLARRANTPERIRTSNLRFRRPMLYPVELRVRRASLFVERMILTNRNRGGKAAKSGCFAAMLVTRGALSHQRPPPGSNRRAGPVVTARTENEAELFGWASEHCPGQFQTGIEPKETKVTKLESRAGNEWLSPVGATYLKPGQRRAFLNSSFPSFPSVLRYWSSRVAPGTKLTVLARKHHLSTMMHDDDLDRNRFVKTCHLRKKEHR